MSDTLRFLIPVDVLDIATALADLKDALDNERWISTADIVEAARRFVEITDQIPARDRRRLIGEVTR